MNFLNSVKLNTIVVIVLWLQYNACYTKILRNPALISKMMSEFHKDNTKAIERIDNDRNIDTRSIDNRIIDNRNIDNRNIENRNIDNRNIENINIENRNIDTDKYIDSTRTNGRTFKKEEPKVISVLQSVLCNNFPSIPCSMIIQDPTLKKLIERSIQQVNYKKLAIEKTTQRTPQFSLTLFPELGSEDLPNFLSLSDVKRFTKIERKDNDDLDDQFDSKKGPRRFTMAKRKSRLKLDKNRITKEKAKEKIKDTRKSIRKFYPQKNKYKDKALRNPKDEFAEFSGEKLSMSVEVPDLNVVKTDQNAHFSYKFGHNEDPVWGIDYMKHSGPDFNVFGPTIQDDRLRGKLIKTGPNVIIDDGDRNFRKEILHPDVYIKKNLGRRQSVDLNSDGN